MPESGPADARLAAGALLGTVPAAQLAALHRPPVGVHQCQAPHRVTQSLQIGANSVANYYFMMELAEVSSLHSIFPYSTLTKSS